MMHRGNVIDMDTHRRLNDEQRHELITLVWRTLELARGFIRVEYLAPSLELDQPARLRITYRIKNERNATLLDPSCTCGPGGRPIHLWELTVDRPLLEDLPDWWILGDFAHTHQPVEGSSYDDFAHGQRFFVCATCPAHGHSDLREDGPIEWSNE